MKLSLPILVCSLGVCLVLSAGAAHAATIQDYFSMNTAGLAGTAGAIDLQFNPGLVSAAQTASATVMQFTGASLDVSHTPSNTGNASGSLPGTLQFDNGKQLNDVFTPVIFGSSFNFVLTLSGPAVDSPDSAATYGSIFVMGLFSSDGSKPLITSDGILATLGLGPKSAATTPTTFSSLASITPVGAVPEPSVMPLFALGLAALLGLRMLSRASA